MYKSECVRSFMSCIKVEERNFVFLSIKFVNEDIRTFIFGRIYERTFRWRAVEWLIVPMVTFKITKSKVTSTIATIGIQKIDKMSTSGR